MELFLKGLYHKTTKTQRSFEHRGSKFVLVNVSLESPLSEKIYKMDRPRHWRITDGKNPPFDISIYNKEILKEITFFIADNKIDLKETQPRYTLKSGIPKFNRELWADDSYYIDNDGSVEISFFEDKIYCMFSNSISFKIVKIDEKLECVFDIENKLIGIVLTNIQKEEMNILHESDLI